MDKFPSLQLSKSQEERAMEIHRKAIVVDELTDSINLNTYQQDTEKFFSHVTDYFQRMQKAGLNVVTMTVAGDMNLQTAMERVSELYYVLTRIGVETICPVTSAEDMERAKKEGKLGINLVSQGIAPICTSRRAAGNVRLLDTFRKLGIQTFMLTYNYRSLAGDGCNERQDSGLSRFGVKVVEEMNRLHMMIDLSHCGYKTTLEAIELSSDPVSFNHTNPKTLNDNVRNKTDEEIKALAKKGGGHGNYVLFFFGGRYEEARASDNRALFR